MHYLESEIHQLFQSDNTMWNFVQRASLDGVWYWDLENPENLWISPEYWQCLGIDPATRKHAPEEFISVVFEEDLPQIMDNLERHYADPSIPYEQIVRFKHADGSTIWVRCKGIAQRNAMGKAIRMLGAHNNLTAVKSAETKLQDINERYQLVVRGLTVGIWDWNIKTDELYWSPRFKEIIGLPEDEKLSYDDFESRLHPDDKQHTLMVLQGHLKRECPYNIECRFLHASGHYIWIKAMGQASWNKDNEPVRMVGSVEDVTAKLKAELQRAKFSKEQAKLNEFNQAILNSSKHLVVSTDLEGMVTHFNKASELNLGYTAQEVVGKQTPALWHDGAEVVKRAEVLSEEFGEKIEPGFDTFVIKARKFGTDTNEWTFTRKDGSCFPVSLTVTCIRDISDNITGYLGVIEDITERKKSENKLKQTNEELEQFAYRTSHDLRSPLVSSIGLLNFIEKEIPNDNERLNKSVSIVKNSLGHLELLIADILELTKTKNLQEDCQWVNVEEIIVSSCEKLSYMSDFERIVFDQELNFSGDIYTEKGKLVLILENLISNAIKYQDLDKKQPIVKLLTTVKDNSFIFEITDNGLGIPKDEQASLFSMFKRFHPKVSFGSGLGLYMIKKAVEAINGCIEYKDTGEGSQFRVTIPMQDNQGIST